MPQGVKNLGNRIPAAKEMLQRTIVTISAYLGRGRTNYGA
jgi:hypothetical protein